MKCGVPSPLDPLAANPEAVRNEGVRREMSMAPDLCGYENKLRVSGFMQPLLRLLIIGIWQRDRRVPSIAIRRVVCSA